MTTNILFNAQQAHKKVLTLQDQQRATDHNNKTMFQHLDTKYETLFKKLSDRVNANKADAKDRFSVSNDQQLKLSDQINIMKGTLEVWDGKIRRMDVKMNQLQEIAQMLEDNGIAQTKGFEQTKYDIE